MYLYGVGSIKDVEAILREFNTLEILKNRQRFVLENVLTHINLAKKEVQENENEINI